MEVLRLFQYMNLQGKITAFSFYRSLEYMTDSTGLNRPPVSVTYCHVSNHPLILIIGSFASIRLDGPGMEASKDAEAVWQGV